MKFFLSVRQKGRIWLRLHPMHIVCDCCTYLWSQVLVARPQGAGAGGQVQGQQIVRTSTGQLLQVLAEGKRLLGNFLESFKMLQKEACNAC